MNYSTLDNSLYMDMGTTRLHIATIEESVKAVTKDQFKRLNEGFGISPLPFESITLVIKPVLKPSSFVTLAGSIKTNKKISIASMRKAREAGEMYESNI